MRWKNNEHPNEYKCMFCCHVRTGTIFLGVFSLMMHVLLLSGFVMVLMNPQLHLQQVEVQKSDGLVAPTVMAGQAADESALINDIDVKAISTPDVQDKKTPWGKHRNMKEDKFLTVLMIMGSFFISFLLTYGAVKGHSSYLMPFFCLQLFEFCVSCLSAISYFSYMPDIKAWIALQDWIPNKSEVMSMDPDFILLCLVTGTVIGLSIKAYLINMVWQCYKYLTMGVRHQDTEAVDYETGLGEDNAMLLPPKYEDALEAARNEPPPPPYAI